MGKIKVTNCDDIEGLKVIEPTYLEIPEVILWRLTITMTSKRQELT